MIGVRRLALVGLFALTTAVVSVAPPPATAAVGGPPTVRLVAESSTVVAEGTASFTVEVNNPPSGSIVTLDVYLPIDGDPTALASAVKGTVSGQQFFPGIRLDANTAPDEVTHRLTLSVPTTRDSTGPGFRLKNAGIYPVLIKLMDGRQALSQFTTFLIRVDATSRAVDTAVVLPIDGPPTLQPDGTRRIDAATRERLVSVVRLASLAPNVPLTLALRPDIAEALRLSTDPADQALRAVVQVARQGEVVLDSAVAIDPVKAVRAGLDKVYVAQLRQGQEQLGAFLGNPIPDSGTRFSSVPLDREAITLAQSAGMTTLITPADTLQPATEQLPKLGMIGPTHLVDRQDPSKHLATLVVGHTGLNELLAETREPVLAVRQYLATLQVLAPGLTAPQAGIVVVAPIDWTAAPGGMFDELIRQLGQAGALHPVTVGPVAWAVGPAHHPIVPSRRRTANHRCPLSACRGPNRHRGFGLHGRHAVARSDGTA
jgi:hypothetical protein